MGAQGHFFGSLIDALCRRGGVWKVGFCVVLLRFLAPAPMLPRLTCALSAAFSSFTASMLVRNQAGFGVRSDLFCALCGAVLPLDTPLFLTFAYFPDGRRHFIKPPKLLPTFLKDPYWKRNLLELLAPNYDGCLRGDKGFLPKGPWAVKGMRLKFTVGRGQ